MTNSIKHVFFDLDHTLWDFDKNSGLTFEKIFNLHAIDIVLEDFLNVYEPINQHYWKMYREERISKANLRFGRLKDAFNAVGKRIDDDLIDQLSEDYISHLSHFNYVFDGTVEILDYLKVKYQLHIITNGFEEVQERKMQSSRIRHYFKTVTNSEMAGVKKPNPKIFNLALHQANAQPHESIMIGDSLEADIQGALSVGMEAILFDVTKTHSDSFEKRIEHLMDLNRFL